MWSRWHRFLFLALGPHYRRTTERNCGWSILFRVGLYLLNVEDFDSADLEAGRMIARKMKELA